MFNGLDGGPSNHQSNNILFSSKLSKLNKDAKMIKNSKGLIYNKNSPNKHKTNIKDFGQGSQYRESYNGVYSNTYGSKAALNSLLNTYAVSTTGSQKSPHIMGEKRINNGSHPVTASSIGAAPQLTGQRSKADLRSHKNEARVSSGASKSG